MIKDKLILVDREDNAIGFEDKEICHDGDGILHRAFSVFIFNSRGELLLQQRSGAKRLWPLFWSNTCCSHPRCGEDYLEAAKRRLVEECGINCGLKYLFKFCYTAKFEDKGSENEVCAVLIGKIDSAKSILPNPEEIADTRWIGLDELLCDIGAYPEKYTPWFKIEIERLIRDYLGEIQSAKQL